MKKTLALSIAMLAITASLLAGCSSGKLAQKEIEQIVSNVLIANAEVDTYKFDIEMMATISMTGGSQPGESNMVGNGTGIIDNASKKMQLTMNTVIDIPGEGKENMLMENYLIDGSMYIKVDIPALGEQWMKTKMPAEIWEAESKIDQNLDMLKTAKEVNFLGSEDINGTACYIVEIIPSTEALSKMMSQLQTSEMEDINIKDFDPANLLKEMSIKEWIAKDSYLFMKTENHMLMEISPEDVGASKGDFNKLTEDININMTFYDHNEPVSIELPEKALTAPKMLGFNK